MHLTGRFPSSVASGDLNNDAYLDLAVVNSGSSSLSILINNKNGTFQSHINSLAQTSPLSITIGDFNRDNKLDLAVANDDSFITVLLGNGDGDISEKNNVSY